MLGIVPPPPKNFLHPRLQATVAPQGFDLMRRLADGGRIGAGSRCVSDDDRSTPDMRRAAIGAVDVRPFLAGVEVSRHWGIAARNQRLGAHPMHLSKFRRAQLGLRGVVRQVRLIPVEKTTIRLSYLKNRRSRACWHLGIGEHCKASVTTPC
jgi:hypothetical protein